MRLTTWIPHGWPFPTTHLCSSKNPSMATFDHHKRVFKIIHLRFPSGHCSKLTIKLGCNKWMFYICDQTSSVTTISASHHRHLALLLSQGMQTIALPPQLSHVFLTILATQVILTFSIVVGFCKSLSVKRSWINNFVIQYSYVHPLEKKC